MNAPRGPPLCGVLSPDWMEVGTGKPENNYSDCCRAKVRVHGTDRKLHLSDGCLNIELSNTYFDKLINSIYNAFKRAFKWLFTLIQSILSLRVRRSPHPAKNRLVVRMPTRIAGTHAQKLKHTHTSSRACKQVCLLNYPCESS